MPRLLMLVMVSLLSWCCCRSHNVAAVAIPFRNRKKPWQRNFFRVKHAAPPLSRDVSLAAMTGSNGTITTTNTLPYSDPTATSTCPELPVVYTNSPSVVSKWLSNHVPFKGGVLGFDVESVPDAPWVKNKASFEGPATVQLATPNSALVIHLADRNGRRSRACGNVLEAMLRDSTIVKAGVGIDCDMLELYTQFKRMDARSRVDVGGIGGKDRERVSLKRLTKCVLGVDLNKSRKMAMSNWSRVPLTDAQLAYCARDAWAGAAILEKLAQLDPETFGTEALCQTLALQERPLRKLYSRAKRRKRAKTQLKNILRTDNGFQASPFEGEHDAHRLKNIMDQTAPDRLLVFDVEHLGFTVPSK